jgi:nitroreductase
MDVKEAILRRRSIRAYVSKPVPEDVLNRVLDAARLAPSAKNRQEWRFIVVREAEARKRVVDATNNQLFVGAAPVILVFCATEGDYVMRCGQNGGTVDTSIALSYVTLAAVEEGLGTCWVGSFYEDKMKAALGIPAGARVVAVTPLGYPAEDPPARGRRAMKEVVSFDKWG